MGSTSEYTKSWRAAFRARDPEGYNEYRAEEARKYSRKHPEIRRAATKAWIARNPEKRAAIMKSWSDANPGYNEAWRLSNLQKWIHKTAKSRAKKEGSVFTITPEDIIIPEFCPALGVKLDPAAKRGQPNALSLDKIIPSKGYIPGNIAIISTRANAIKRDASFAELEAISAYIKRFR